MARGKAKQVVEVPVVVEESLLEKVGSEELADFVKDCEEVSLGEGIGYMYRLPCGKCGEPRCTRIVVKHDEDVNLFYKDCAKIFSRQFTNLEVVKNLMGK